MFPGTISGEQSINSEGAVVHDVCLVRMGKHVLRPRITQAESPSQLVLWLRLLITGQTAPARHQHPQTDVKASTATHNQYAQNYSHRCRLITSSLTNH